jgi:hypothetical protein
MAFCFAEKAATRSRRLQVGGLVRFDWMSLPPSTSHHVKSIYAPASHINTFSLHLAISFKTLKSITCPSLESFTSQLSLLASSLTLLTFDFYHHDSKQPLVHYIHQSLETYHLNVHPFHLLGLSINIYSLSTMDTIAQSEFMEFEVGNIYYPEPVLHKACEAPSVQDSAYSSPRPSPSWRLPENMSDSCSGTWSSPTPSIANSPSPRPDFRSHYSTWPQSHPGHGIQPFMSFNQVQCQLDLTAYYQQEVKPQPYYQDPCFQSAASEEHELDTFGVGDWTTMGYPQAPAEQTIESSPAPSSVIASMTGPFYGSPERHTCPLIKQEEPEEHEHTCTHSLPKKDRANKSKTAYPCPFIPYGCPASFSSKNEWKRHLNTQHLSLSTYRCDLCIPKHGSSSSPHQFNDFNRKDLFVQHLRRMHCKSSSESTSAIYSNKTARYDCIMIPDTPISLAKQADRCYIPPPSPPVSAQCIFCCSTFSGSQAWVLRTEHISHHLERLRRDEEEVPKVEKWRRDAEVERWCLEVGILVLYRGRDGTGRLRVKTGKRL